MDCGASLCGSVGLIASKASGVIGIETMRAHAFLSDQADGVGLHNLNHDPRGPFPVDDGSQIKLINDLV